ncbi:MAG: hypothetical protein KJO61_11310 [Deltaproteobacteria bacterium]|nr:hypothetical protein [Deltaproteobacteria bacterium]NNK85527.1 hypothetical protein [Desulfobacterales bacterium]NNL32908.1 hypothetical protein [Flavobacteriaceae bacterium]
MKPKATNEKVSASSPILTQVIRKSLFICLLFAGIVPTICFIFGWRSLENIGSGFIYGSLGLILFGVLMLAGNTAPAQLSKLSLPKYNPPSLKRHQQAESDGSPSIQEGVRFFFATLTSGAFLSLIGFFLKMLS